MKKTILLALMFVSAIAFGQTEKKKEIKKEVKIENADGKYTVTLVTTENGETKTVTRTYDSMEEMKNDPEMGDMKIMTLHDKGSNVMFFSDEDGDNEKDVRVIVRKSGDGEAHADHDIEMDGEHTFVFKSGEEGSDMHNIKVWIDENGEKHVSRNGVEIEGNSWTSKDGKTYDIQKTDGKVMFLSEDQAAEFITEDGKHIDVKVKVDGENLEDGDIEKEVIIIKSATGEGSEDGEKIVIKIVEEIKIHLEELHEDDFADMPGVDAKALKLEDLNYYPNPNSGKFTLAFQSDKKPTEIKITGIDGKEVYAEQLQSFEGSYNKEIDLSGQKPGIYLLQILQGKKAMNKKIVIE